MKITASHGSGGKLTAKLVRDVFLANFQNAELRRLDDGAFFSPNSKRLVITTDSFVVDPIFFPGGDIGKLAVAGTVNDLAAMGAEPVCLTAAFIVQEGFDTAELERIAKSMANTAQQVGVQILAGDTKVVERCGQTSGVFINTTGVGRVYKDVPGADSCSAGDVVIVNGTIAQHGFAVLSSRLKSGRVESDCAPLWEMVKAVLDVAPVKFMRDPTRGGLAAVLNELVETRNFGIRIFEERLPISEEVFGLSELLGISPLEVASEGRMLFVVDANHTDTVLKALKAHPLGKDAAVIGELCEDAPGKVLLRTLYGSEHIVGMPVGEQLPRIC